MDDISDLESIQPLVVEIRPRQTIEQATAWNSNSGISVAGSAGSPTQNPWLKVPLGERETNSVIDDLGDAKRLAENLPVQEVSSLNHPTRSQLVFGSGSNFPEASNGVYNIEDDLNQPDDSHVEKSESVPEITTSLTLSRKLRAKLQTSSWEKEDRKFLPLDELGRIVTEDVIGKELARHGEIKAMVTAAWGMNTGKTVVDLVSETWGIKCGRYRETTRRKIFAILALIDEIPSITDFIKGNIHDNDLPFIFEAGKGGREGSYDVYCKPRGDEGKNSGSPIVKIDFFDQWKDTALSLFSLHQWQLLAPDFFMLSKGQPKIHHYPLENEIVLPFTEDHHEGDEIPGIGRGGSSEVRRVKIHHAHQNLFRTREEAEKHSYAIKRLHSTDGKAFKQEVNNLEKFIGDKSPDHRHLISLLLTYEYRGQYHLLFHWADGNLLDYWMKIYPGLDSPMRDVHFARWMSRQLLGIVKGLQAIHLCTANPTAQYSANSRIHGRHGDLKPENILWFRRHLFDGEKNDPLGVLVISDFGLTRFHREKSKSHVESKNLGRSPTYRPPEFDVNRDASPKCDIWSLGCVMLELLVWYSYGSEGVQSFEDDRVEEDNAEIDIVGEDKFFILKDKTQPRKGARKKMAVAKTFADLYEDRNSTEFFVDVLQLVEMNLLRMHPRDRLSCEDIVGKLASINERCIADADYCTKPSLKASRRQPTDLSELTPSPCEEQQDISAKWPASRLNESGQITGEPTQSWASETDSEGTSPAVAPASAASAAMNKVQGGKQVVHKLNSSRFSGISTMRSSLSEVQEIVEMERDDDFVSPDKEILFEGAEQTTTTLADGDGPNTLKNSDTSNAMIASSTAKSPKNRETTTSRSESLSKSDSRIVASHNEGPEELQINNEPGEVRDDEQPGENLNNDEREEVPIEEERKEIQNNDKPGELTIDDQVGERADNAELGKAQTVDQTNSTNGAEASILKESPRANGKKIEERRYSRTSKLARFLSCCFR